MLQDVLDLGTALGNGIGAPREPAFVAFEELCLSDPRPVREIRYHQGDPGASGVPKHPRECPKSPNPKGRQPKGRRGRGVPQTGTTLRWNPVPGSRFIHLELEQVRTKRLLTVDLDGGRDFVRRS